MLGTSFKPIIREDARGSYQDLAQAMLYALTGIPGQQTKVTLSAAYSRAGMLCPTNGAHTPARRARHAVPNTECVRTRTRVTAVKIMLSPFGPGTSIVPTYCTAIETQEEHTKSRAALHARPSAQCSTNVTRSVVQITMIGIHQFKNTLPNVCIARGLLLHKQG